MITVVRRRELGKIDGVFVPNVIQCQQRRKVFVAKSSTFCQKDNLLNTVNTVTAEYVLTSHTHSNHSNHSSRPGRHSDVIVAFDGAAMAPPLGREYERIFKQGTHRMCFIFLFGLRWAIIMY